MNNTSIENHDVLAVIRCGDSSLHDNWIIGARHFDYAVSYFGSDKNRDFIDAKYVHKWKGGKWDGLYKFFLEFPEALEKYNFFWFPDDDLSASAADINLLLSIGKSHDLEIFQPSLSSKSYYSHLITLHHSNFLLRFTNFVEIMSPVVSKRLLIRTLPMMEHTRSGFGLDFLWPRVAEEIQDSSSPTAAVIDAVQILHTRPVGGDLHKYIHSATGGQGSNDELNRVVSDFSSRRAATINKVSVPRIRVTGGLLISGRQVSKIELFARILFDFIKPSKNSVQPVRKISAIRYAMKVFFP